MADEHRHAGKVAIVTGAASGIGAATADLLLAGGASVLAADRDEERLREWVTAAADRVGQKRVRPCLVDVSDPGSAEAMVDEALARFDGLDVLVNNAGISRVGLLSETEFDQWRRVMSVNLDGVFLVTKAALPHLIAAGSGAIVNTASISGLLGDYGLAAYTASKAGVANLTRTLAIDHAKDGIRVNSVCPGPVRTEITRRMMDDPAMIADYAEKIPIGRVAKPKEIAAAISFLASPEASYITGHNLVVDGGVTAATGQPNFQAYVERVKAERSLKG